MSNGDVMMAVRKRADADRDLKRAARAYDELRPLIDQLSTEEYVRYHEIANSRLGVESQAFLANVSDEQPEIIQPEEEEFWEEKPSLWRRLLGGD